jgi:DNA polymerase III epsilon subunit-like protein
MSVLVFDVETTGLPVRESLYKRMPDPKKFEFYNEARIVELAYKIFDSQDRLVKAVSVLIKPEIEITNSDIALAHFLIDLDNVDSIVSHNMEFDKNLVLSEMWRLVSTGNNGYNINYLDIETLTNKPSVCTMKLGQTKLNYTKYPKLIELFKTLCGNKTWKQDHRALDDVDKCAQCYFKLKN